MSIFGGISDGMWKISEIITGGFFLEVQLN